MKRLLFLILLVAVAAWPQTSQNGRVETGLNGTKPATCSPGDQFNATDTFQIFLCGPSNTWVLQVGGGGGGGTPGSPTNSLQFNSGGSFGGAAGITTPDGNSLSIKGVDPWIDVTAYGARAVPWYGISSTDATIGVGSHTVTLTDHGFQNGDGITIWGAGAANGLGTPGAPTVTPSIAAGGTSTGIVKTTTLNPNGTSGATTYNYVLIARDKFGGLTPAGSIGTTTTGSSSLGLQTATLTTCTRSNDTVTCDTSAAEGIIAGALVHLHGTSNSDFTGFYTVDHVNSTSEFVMVTTPIDSRGLGSTFQDSTSSSGGTVAYYLSNHLTWTAVSGSPWEYYACAKRPGDSFYHLIGQTKPSSSAIGWQDVQFDDYGSPFMDSQAYPLYVQTAAEAAAPNVHDAICTSVTSLPDPLTTTITAGGGTGTLTLADPAQTSVTGQTALYDAAPNILTAAKASALAIAPTNNSAGGVLYFPPSAVLGVDTGYAINSYLKLPPKLSIAQAGSLFVGETLEIGGDTTWDGHWGERGIPQFGFTGTASIFGIGANPLVYAGANPGLLSYVFLGPYIQTNGGTLYVNDGQNGDFDYVSFNGGGQANSDYLSVDLLMRSDSSGGNSYRFRKALMNGGPNQVVDKSWTPLVYMPPNQNGSGGLLGNQSYFITCDTCFMSRRGWEEETAGGNGARKSFTEFYRQGGITPVFLEGGSIGGTSGQIRFNGSVQDTESLPTITFTGSVGQWDVELREISNSSADTGGIPPTISGFRPVHIQADSSFTGKLPNLQAIVSGRPESDCIVVYPYNITGTNPCTQLPVYDIPEPMRFPSNHQLFWPLSTPSSVSAAVGAGGALSAGTYYYDVSSVDVNGGETTVASTPSSACTTSGGNLTCNVSWTNPVGALSSNIYRCVTSCVLSDGRIGDSGNWRLIGTHQAGTSFADVGAGIGQTPPTTTGAALTAVNALGFVGKQIISPETTAPSGIAGFDILYADSTAHAFKVNQNNAGAQAFVTTAVASPTANDCVNWTGTGFGIGDPGGKCARYTITPVNGDCVTWSGTGGLLGDAGGACTAGAGGMNTNLSNMAVPTAMNTGLTCTAVNTCFVGTQAVPMTQLALGTIANQAGTFDTTALTTNRSVKWPDAATVLPQPLTPVSHQFATALSGTSGAFTLAQPTLADIAAGASPAGLFNFAASTMRIPEGAGATASASSTLILDTTAKAVHTLINAADAQVAGFAAAPAGSKCLQSSGTLGLLAETSAACGTWTDSSTQIGTNKTLSQEGTGNVITTVGDAWVRTAGCNNTTAAAAVDLPTTGVPTPNCLTGTNVMKATLDFDDSVNEFMQFDTRLPHTWVGNIDVNIIWLVSAGGGSNAVKWTIQTACSADGASFDTAFNAAQTVTTNVAANNVQTVSQQNTVTVTGCAVDNIMNFKIGRDTTDTFTGTARMIGVQYVVRHTGR